MEKEVGKIIAENNRRIKIANAPFNPITGEGSIGERVLVEIPDFPLPSQYLPVSMAKVPLIKQLVKAGSVRTYAQEMCADGDDVDKAMHTIIDQVIRLRMKHDFPFWAAWAVYIKPKGGGEDVLFRLNRPQRRMATRFEKRRLSNKPIRMVVLKARQWGGSTCTQMYFEWLQLCHKVGLNSLIVAQVKATANTIQAMFANTLNKYPIQYLYELGETYSEKEEKWCGVGSTLDSHRIPQRACTITIGSAEKPDSVRGADYNLVHCSEVGLWKKTEGRTPEDIVRSACSGITLRPYTAIVYESTANGTGNFFQREYDAAKNGLSAFEAMFVPWFEIENYAMPFDDDKQRDAFAESLYINRNNKNVESDREEPGVYLWWLWGLGATLENIHWYIEERKKFSDHGHMASEYPSDDVEAFTHSGQRVFDKYLVEKFRSACKPPYVVGDVYADGRDGKSALTNVRFAEDHQGLLRIWSPPEPDEGEEEVLDRYIVSVDIGGRSDKADWSVVSVFDRIYMMDGDAPTLVAQWRGHIDIDLLAWKAAQIARYYNNALLVIESNTLETHDRERQIEGGDQSLYVLNQIRDVYDNLYARQQTPEQIEMGEPRQYGFHTNTKTKPLLISFLVKVVREHLYVERDVYALDEYLWYERKQNGAYGAIIGKHDDVLMSRAIGLYICYHEMELPRIVKKSRFAQKTRSALGVASM